MNKTMPRVKRVDQLTPPQQAQMTAWADRWIEIGLRTGDADRPKFEAAAQRCYEAAGLPWPGRVVWVPSPIVMAIAAPIASYLIARQRNTSVSGAVDGAVRGAVGDAVRDAVSGAVGDAVDGAVRDAVDGANPALSRQIRQEVAQAISNGWFRYLGGQFWSGGYYWGGAFTSFFREVCGLELQGDLWQRGEAYEATIESACWWYPHRDFVMVCERPTVISRELVDPNVPRGWGSHRLHSDTGPAVGFRDGWGIWAIHGTRVPQYVVEHPQQITVAAIDAETNAEVRRVMIDRYGPDRYVVDSGAKVVHELPADHPQQGLRTARLLVKPVPDDEPIVFVDLLNSTPEPDGTTKRYMLRVDPNAYDGEASRNAHAAAASTWRDGIGGSLTYRDWRDYAPACES